MDYLDHSLRPHQHRNQDLLVFRHAEFVGSLCVGVFRLSFERIRQDENRFIVFVFVCSFICYIVRNLASLFFVVRIHHKRIRYFSVCYKQSTIDHHFLNYCCLFFPSFHSQLTVLRKYQHSEKEFVGWFYKGRNASSFRRKVRRITIMFLPKLQHLHKSHVINPVSCYHCCCHI